MDMGNKRYLAPIADMFNHSTEVQSCHFYDLNSNNLKIFAGKNYNAGDQVRFKHLLKIILYTV